jgi:hypothetical protein
MIRNSETRSCYPREPLFWRNLVLSSPVLGSDRYRALTDAILQLAGRPGAETTIAV